MLVDMEKRLTKDLPRCRGLAALFQELSPTQWIEQVHGNSSRIPYCVWSELCWQLCEESEFDPS